jgi:hypothetical protein
MWTHRLAGGFLAALGLTLLGLQLALLYGSAEERGWMVAIGLTGTAVLSALGAVSFSAGCLLAIRAPSPPRLVQPWRLSEARPERRLPTAAALKRIKATSATEP